MTDTNTAKLGITNVAANSSQKHVAVNEGWRVLDALTQIGVIDKDVSTPPTSPALGDTYIVGPGPTSLWAGQAGNIAYYDGGAWFFHRPKDGWLAVIKDEDALYRYRDTAWGIISSEGGGGGGGDISGLTAQVSSNTADIADNAAGIAGNVTAIANNTGDIAELKNRPEPADTANFSTVDFNEDDKGVVTVSPEVVQAGSTRITPRAVDDTLQSIVTNEEATFDVATFDGAAVAGRTLSFTLVSKDLAFGGSLPSAKISIETDLLAGRAFEISNRIPVSVDVPDGTTGDVIVRVVVTTSGRTAQVRFQLTDVLVYSKGSIHDAVQSIADASAHAVETSDRTLIDDLSNEVDSQGLRINSLDTAVSDLRTGDTSNGQQLGEVLSAFESGSTLRRKPGTTVTTAANLDLVLGISWAAFYHVTNGSNEILTDLTGLSLAGEEPPRVKPGGTGLGLGDMQIEGFPRNNFNTLVGGSINIVSYPSESITLFRDASDNRMSLRSDGFLEFTVRQMGSGERIFVDQPLYTNAGRSSYTFAGASTTSEGLFVANAETELVALFFELFANGNSIATFRRSLRIPDLGADVAEVRFTLVDEDEGISEDIYASYAQVPEGSGNRFIKLRSDGLSENSELDIEHLTVTAQYRHTEFVAGSDEDVTIKSTVRLPVGRTSRWVLDYDISALTGNLLVQAVTYDGFSIQTSAVHDLGHPPAYFGLQRLYFEGGNKAEYTVDKFFVLSYAPGGEKPDAVSIANRLMHVDADMLALGLVRPPEGAIEEIVVHERTNFDYLLIGDKRLLITASNRLFIEDADGVQYEIGGS